MKTRCEVFGDLFEKGGDPAELVTIPKGLVLSIRLELLLLVAMPLLAVIMAKGLGIPVVNYVFRHAIRRPEERPTEA